MADNKERHSRMAYSTVRAPPKKDGKGGKFTWGDAFDVPANFVPVGLGGSYVAVSTSAQFSRSDSPVAASPVAASTPKLFQTSFADESEFPPLGATAPRVRTISTGWGPSTPTPSASDSSGVAALDMTRALRAPELFDAQHPRNRFAPAPRKVSAGGRDLAIDWSEHGIPRTVRSSFIQNTANPAHLSIYAAAPAQPVPAAVLRSHQPARPMPPQKVAKPVAPRPMMIHQPQRR